MPEEVLRIHSLRFERMKRTQTIQHVVAAFILLSTAYDHLTRPAEHGSLILSSLEIFAGLLLLGSVLRERIHHQRAKKGLHAPHRGVGWVEIAGGVMGAVEWISRLNEHHHLSFRILTLVPIAILLITGIFEVKLAALPFMRVDDDGFSMRLRWFRIHKLLWRDADAFRITPTAIEFRLRNGRSRKVKIKDVKEKEAASAWAKARFLERGLQELPA